MTVNQSQGSANLVARITVNFGNSNDPQIDFHTVGRDPLDLAQDTDHWLGFHANKLKDDILGSAIDHHDGVQASCVIGAHPHHLQPISGSYDEVINQISKDLRALLKERMS